MQKQMKHAKRVRRCWRRRFDANIQGGTIEFDRCIATPDMMPVVGRLVNPWPTQLMPNPKVGTVTMDVAQLFRRQKVAIQFKAKKAVCTRGWQSVIRRSLLKTPRIRWCRCKSKPTGAKGAYEGHHEAHNGPGVTVNVDNAAAE